MPWSTQCRLAGGELTSAPSCRAKAKISLTLSTKVTGLSSRIRWLASSASRRTDWLEILHRFRKCKSCQARRATRPKLHSAWEPENFAMNGLPVATRRFGTPPCRDPVHFVARRRGRACWQSEVQYDDRSLDQYHCARVAWNNLCRGEYLAISTPKNFCFVNEPGPGRRSKPGFSLSAN